MNDRGIFKIGGAQSRFQLCREGAVHKQATRGDAGCAVVEPQTEFNRAHHEIEIRVGTDKHRVAAGQLDGRRRERLAALREDDFSGGGASSQYDFIDAKRDRGLRGCWWFG